MTKIAAKLSLDGFTLRSGGAVGADIAFGIGSTRSQIFVPWRGFNGFPIVYKIPDEAYEIASELHPAWQYLKQPARTMMARNCMQVLGPNLDNPSRFVICWTPDGIEKESQRTKKSGGTAQAVSHASRLGIPVYNLQLHKRVTMFERYVDEN